MRAPGRRRLDVYSALRSLSDHAVDGSARMPSGLGRANNLDTNDARSPDNSKSALYNKCNSVFRRRMSMVNAHRRTQRRNVRKVLLWSDTTIDAAALDALCQVRQDDLQQRIVRLHRVRLPLPCRLGSIRDE